MLKFEEYVARRKKEDRLNELDADRRIENMRVCINYVFEYFNNYLETNAEDKTVLQNEKIEKYRKKVREYDHEVQDWLVNIHTEYGNDIYRIIGVTAKENEYFFLFNTDLEFRNLSYDCYSKLVRRYPYLKDQTEMLFLFIKNYQKILSEQQWRSDFPFISNDINYWIEDTWAKYHVNIVAFVHSWAMYFWDHKDIWPVTHRKKSYEEWLKYEYDFRHSGNLFNLDSLYIKMPKKPFTRGRKQEFEVLMMYTWLHHVVGDETGYWQEYLEKVLPVMNRG